MQVTELAPSSGLKRAFSVVVPAADIAARCERRLADLARTVRIPGFRPGKVPPAVVKRRYGTTVLGEVLEEAVNEASHRVVSERGLRPALRPRIEIVNFTEGADLELRLDLEILPEIPIPDLSVIALERLKAEPGEAEIAKALATLAERHGTLEEVEPRPAAVGEVLICDFVGTLVSDLLRNGPGLGALPGHPGHPPEGWQILTPPGVEQAITATGREQGLPYFDLAFSGMAEGGMARIELGPVPLDAGDLATFEVQVRLLGETALPALALRLGEARAEVPLRGEALRAALVAPAAEPIAAIEVPLPAGAASVALRIGPARLFPGQDDPPGQTFAGGAARDVPIEIGGAGFVAGFSEQLLGLAPGESRVIGLVFPPDYPSPELAGKRARFAVTAKALRRRRPHPIDDDLAKAVGVADVAQLREAVEAALKREYEALSRLRLKRALLDYLAERAAFPVPEGMVEAEFAEIWRRVEADFKAGRLDAEDRGKDEATLRAEYRAIAERRIRLGLLLSEIGRLNNIQVSAEEMARAMREEARRYPGQEQQILDFLRHNPQAAESLRAPIFEDKVVDFVLALATISERSVSPAELLAAA